MAHIVDLQCLWKDQTAAFDGEELGRTSSQQNILSVILITHSSYHKFIQVLQSVLAQLFIREIIIVDVECSSKLEEMLRPLIHLQPKCRLIKGRSQMGLSAAYNLGAQYASCQFFLFLDGTLQLSPHITKKLLSTGLPKPSPWVIGIKEQLPPFLEKTLSPYQHESTSEVTVAGGGYHVFAVAPKCLFLSAQTYVALKGLDTHYPAVFHLDLCWQIHLKGGGVYELENFLVQPFSQIPSSWYQACRHEWRAMRGWQAFHQKYISHNVNIFSHFVFYGRVAWRFFTRLSLLCFGLIFSKGLTKAAITKRRAAEGGI